MPMSETKKEIMNHIDINYGLLEMAYQLNVPEEIKESEEIEEWLINRFSIQTLFKMFLEEWIDSKNDPYEGLSKSAIKFLEFKI